MALTLVETVPWHVASVRERLTPASTHDCRHIYGVDIRTVLDVTWSISDRAWTLLADELPICITSVYEASTGVGQPWTFLTNEIEHHRIGFLWWSKFVLEKYQENFGILELWLNSENERSLRWHRWLGFSLHPRAPYGPRGALCVYGVRMQEV